jgi:hypothetical protein
MIFTSNVLGVVKKPEIPNRRAPKIQGGQGAILCSDRLYLLLQFLFTIQGKLKVLTWLQTFITKKLRGIQTYATVT